MDNPQRVHICPISYEVDRVILPLVKMRADKAYLITKRSAPERDKARRFLENIEQVLKVHDVPFKVLRCDIDDFHDCLHEIGLVIQGERSEGNAVLVNISTGGRVVSHASAVAGMMYGASLYYAEPEKDDREEREYTHGLRQVLPIPAFHIEPPDLVSLDCLEAIKGAGGSVHKRQLIEHFRSRGLVTARSTKPQAVYGVVKRLCQPMIDRGWVEEVGRTRARKVQITPEGERILKGFRGA
jgi:hypothetical protein